MSQKFRVMHEMQQGRRGIQREEPGHPLLCTAFGQHDGHRDYRPTLKWRLWSRWAFREDAAQARAGIDAEEHGTDGNASLHGGNNSREPCASEPAAQLNQFNSIHYEPSR